jgi:hypothetical protein
MTLCVGEREEGERSGDEEADMFESCFVCDECEKDASREYDQFSFVAPYQK